VPSFKSGRLAVVSLPATDVVASAHFYRDVVGLRLLPHHGHRPAFELENECFLVIVPGKASTALETDE
jgi:catechol 2,3-dioxygenase-like lactoylglutathione lyase family enzyme